MELAGDGVSSRWNAKASQDSPEESTIDGVVGFGNVDKSHEQRGVLPRQFVLGGTPGKVTIIMLQYVVS